MHLRPPGYEPDKLNYCSTLRYSDVFWCAENIINPCQDLRSLIGRSTDMQSPRAGVIGTVLCTLENIRCYSDVSCLRILLAAFSPQLSSSVPPVRPNLVQDTPSLRLSNIRYYLVFITLSTKKPSLRRACLVCNEVGTPFTRQASLLEWLTIQALV